MSSSDTPVDRRLAAIFEAEAAEHVQRMQSVLAGLDVDGAPAGDALSVLFRAAHSLKGAARAVGEDEIETLCHASEGVLAALQRGRLAWTRPVADALHDVGAALERGLREGRPAGSLAALVPRLQALLRSEAAEPGRTDAAASAQAAAPAPAAPPPVPATADGEQTVRIGVERLARLLYRAEELAAALRGQPAFGPAVDALLADVKSTLLLPVGSLRPFLAATVRELARSQGKEVELRLHGDDVEMDRRLLQELREPLVHLLRNAVGHGMETSREREAAGKPPRGLVEVAIAARSGRVEITVRDDGAGIDTGRLAQSAREHGLPVPDGAQPAELLPLVFGAGISTAPQVTQVSGRGIGLAIVRDTVERLGGTASVASTPGQGTSFHLALPLSLANYRAIEVRVAGRSFLLPTARTERCLRVEPSALRVVGERQAVEVGEQSLPLASLAGVLGLARSPAPTGRIACLVLAAGERRVALAVDEIRGEQEVMVRTLDPGLALGAVVAGAAMLPGGGAAPILNASELVRIATGENGRQAATEPAAAAAPRGRSVLLAEDSITSRTLLKNILELAGHRVEIAVDGGEALDKLRAGSFDLVVSDVEMPRLDGIALTEAIRQDPALAHLPVVLVTSLASPADRERGAEAGANAYIVKSSFDQGDLLGAIAELA